MRNAIRRDDGGDDGEAEKDEHRNTGAVVLVATSDRHIASQVQVCSCDRHPYDAQRAAAQSGTDGHGWRLPATYRDGRSRSFGSSAARVRMASVSNPILRRHRDRHCPNGTWSHAIGHRRNQAVCDKSYWRRYSYRRKPCYWCSTCNRHVVEQAQQARQVQQEQQAQQARRAERWSEPRPAPRWALQSMHTTWGHRTRHPCIAASTWRTLRAYWAQSSRPRPRTLHLRQQWATRPMT